MVRLPKLTAALQPYLLSHVPFHLPSTFDLRRNALPTVDFEAIKFDISGRAYLWTLLAVRTSQAAVAVFVSFCPVN